MNITHPNVSATAGRIISVQVLGAMIANSSITTPWKPTPRNESGWSAPNIWSVDPLNNSIFNSVSFLLPPKYISGLVYIFKYSQAIDFPCR